MSNHGTEDAKKINLGGTQSAAAFTAFQSAETLMKQPNGTELDAAIEKYKQAVELDPRHASAYARLAQAYTQLSVIRRSPAGLDRARENCQAALSLDPDLVEGHLAQAAIFDYSGDKERALDAIAKALSLDPSNPKALVWQAQIYTRLNQWADAEKTFRRVLKEHPDYWLANNELGFGLQKQGRYQEAVEAFHAASLAAPGNSLALSNLGGQYLQIGEFAKATETLEKCLAMDPHSDYAAGYTSLAMRYQGKYEAALPFALKAVELNEGLDTHWLELADCYSSLPSHQSEAKEAYLRAAKEADRHLSTDATDGPSWMLLALYKVKSGNPEIALSLIKKAESFGAHDMDSQLYKARILELIGKREEALTTIAACFSKGATELQIVPFPDLQSLRQDPRYRQSTVSQSLAS
jgi:tetratricopeptide (TPR) repeat protein